MGVRADVAAVFADARARTWCEAQRVILDVTLEALADQFAEHPPFDADWFMDRAQYRRGRSS